MNKRRYLIFTGLVLLILGGLSITLYLTQKPQDQRGIAQSCQSVPSVLGVTVEYPGCDSNNQCNFTTASCSWSALAQATSYLITVTELETSNIVLNNQSYPSSTTQVIFPITNNKTYKCDVVAVNSCGNQSAAASDQLLCVTDALISPTVTSTPTRTPTPTVTLTSILPTATPKPINTVLTATPTLIVLASPLPTATGIINQPGSSGQTLSIIGGVVISILGGILLLAL